MRHTLKLAASLLLVTALITGCAQRPTIQPGTFPEAEYATLAKEGTGTVKGQLFMKTLGGDVKYGAGVEVVLVPATTYSAYFWRAYQTNAVPGPSDPRMKPFTLRTQTDGGGNFEFHDVPPGNYYISGDVIWQAPTKFGLAQQGGWVMKEVAAKNGSEVRVIVTR